MASSATQSQHLEFMQQALAQAKLAAELGEVPVGAVVVVEESIIARAHNRVESLNDATAHAEILALKAASEMIGSWRLSDASLYVTMEPCTMCFGAIINSRVKDLFFGCYDQRHGALGSIYNLNDSLAHVHTVNIYPELLADECREVVQNFFKEKR